MGRIRLQGIRAFCRVGHDPREREAGHHLDVDVEVHLDLRHAVETDELASTLDYAAAARAVRDALGTGEYVLLEAAAGAALEALRGMAPDAREIRVRVRKRRPPIPDVHVDLSEVELRWPPEEAR